MSVYAIDEISPWDAFTVAHMILFDATSGRCKRLEDDQLACAYRLINKAIDLTGHRDGLLRLLNLQPDQQFSLDEFISAWRAFSSYNLVPIGSD